jgi:hypothetical protein
MQTVLQVVCTRGRSLRETIANDGRLADFGLLVTKEKQALRYPGWMKLIGNEGQRGAINVAWDADTQMLSCRVITRGGNPGRIIGDLVCYLLNRHKRRVLSIQVLTNR